MDRVRVLLGVDVGSTNIKCVAVEPQTGRCLAASSLPSADALRQHAERRLDADKLFLRGSEVIRQALSQLPASSEVLGVACASVGCTAFALDGADEQIHLDGIAPAQMREDCAAVTGFPWDYPNAGALLVAAARQARLKGVSKVLSVADYMAYRLSGAFARDISTAGSMSMYDRGSGRWWDYFLHESGLSEAQLGQVLPSGARVGAVTPEASRLCRIPEGTPVSLGGHDYPCTAFALGCVGPGSVFNVMGTFEMVVSFAESQPQIPEGWTLFSDCHCMPGRYSLGAEMLSGAQLEWYRRMLGGGGDPGFWARMDEAMRALPPSFEEDRRELFIPRLYGDFFPKRQDGVHGAFLGLSARSDGAAMMRALIEGQLMYSRRMYDHIGGGRRLPVVVAGGGSSGRFLMQAKADIWGARVLVPEVPEAAATGAALLAGVGSGVYRDHAEASRVLSGAECTVYKPNPARHETYDRVFRRVFLPALDALGALDKTNIEMDGERE